MSLTPWEHQCRRGLQSSIRRFKKRNKLERPSGNYGQPTIRRAGSRPCRPSQFSQGFEEETLLLNRCGPKNGAPLPATRQFSAIVRTRATSNSQPSWVKKSVDQLATVRVVTRLNLFINRRKENSEPRGKIRVGLVRLAAYI